MAAFIAGDRGTNPDTQTWRSANSGWTRWRGLQSAGSNDNGFYAVARTASDWYSLSDLRGMGLWDEPFSENPLKSLLYDTGLTSAMMGM